MKLAPSLRFPDFDSDWIKSSLSDAIISLDAGVSVNSEDTPVNVDELGILKTSCVTKGYFDPSENKRVVDPIEISRLKEPVSKDSIVISRMNTPALVGLSGLVSQDESRLFLPDRLWAAKVSSDHYPRWIAQLLASEKVRGQLSDRASGTSGSMKNITKGDVLSLPVVVPSLPEQRKIADFLTAVDGRIAQLSQKKALLEAYKKGVLQQLFTQALRFQDDHGNDFPDWEEKTLGEVCELVNGLTYAPADVTKEGLLVLRSSNVQDGKIVYDDNVFVSSKVNDWNLTRPGDILICVRNGSKSLIGKNAIIPEGGPPSTHGAFMTVLRGTQNRFVFQLLQTDVYKRNVHINLGATINSINGSDLKKFKFSFPSLPEQTKIANFLTALDRKIEAVAAQIAHTQTWKKGLLQQMFV